MARAPDKRIEQAKAMYLKGLKLVEIAGQLNLPEGTVRSWKNRYKWDCNVANEKCNVANKKRGGQPGNKNAEGHGGTGPPQNKNAVKTGEFETLFFDTLNPDEQNLINAVQLDKEQLLFQEIKLLTVREHRMLKRIASLRLLEKAERQTDGSDLDKAPSGMSVIKYTTGLEKGKLTHLKEYGGILGQIQAIEDALTRVQGRRQKAIETLHRFGYDDARLELETMKFELELLKQDGSGSEQEDDGFIDAMNAAAAETWSNADE